MASPWHLQLSTTLYNKLPRELRDQVYGAFWAVEALPVSFHEAPYTHDTPRIIADTRREVALEAAQYYYETEPIFTIRAPEKINLFLIRDVFELGLAPKDYKLKKLVVHLNVQHVAVYVEKSMLLSQFQLLPALKLKQGFELELKIAEGNGSTSSMRAVELQRIGAAVKPILNAIQAKGGRVRVSYFPNDHSVICDITRTFGGTIETWMGFLDELITRSRVSEQHDGDVVGSGTWPVTVANFRKLEQKIVKEDLAMAKIKLMLQKMKLESGREF